MSTPDWARPRSTTWTHEPIPDREELAALIRRAAALGIPAWRVMTALGLPPGDDTAARVG